MSGPVFLLASDLRPDQPLWTAASAEAEALAGPSAQALGFRPEVHLAPLDSLAGAMQDRLDAGAEMMFILPAVLDLHLGQREVLGQAISECRRKYPAAEIYHDDVDLGYPVLADCMSLLIAREIESGGLAPGRVGLLLAAEGHGDASSRAQTYRLMRMLWERLSLPRADVGFIRHARPFFCEALESAAREPLAWMVLPLSQWATEHVEYARLMLHDFRRSHHEAEQWRFIEPPGRHPMLDSWLLDRMLRLWRERLHKDDVRVRSARHAAVRTHTELWTGEGWAPAQDAKPDPDCGIVGRLSGSEKFGALLRRVLPASEEYIVKVTWHGYAPGTYTDPAALDAVLSALPGRAILVEGHTTSRNLGSADWDWMTQARRHRGWIAAQEAEYLARTGLAQVIADHDAVYLNVTEAWWDGACAPAEEVLDLLGPHVRLNYPELAGFIPQALLRLRSTPFLSLARFKGPTRLAISNLFGLLPPPLRTEWHGNDIADFARVCCDLARIYGALFRPYALVEALHTAVRWNRKGLYRSHWGNYDIVRGDGQFTCSRGFAAADILASRLQGQDVNRSAFFGVVREELIWPQSAVDASLPIDVQALFA
jgi:hypothetical protein